MTKPYLPTFASPSEASLRRVAVRFLFIVDADGQDGAGRRTHHGLRHGAEQRARDTAAAVRAHHDEVGAELDRGLVDDVLRIACLQQHLTDRDARAAPTLGELVEGVLVVEQDLIDDRARQSKAQLGIPSAGIPITLTRWIVAPSVFARRRRSRGPARRRR